MCCPGGCLVGDCPEEEPQGRLTFLLFVDLSKAYDTVSHEALFAKLDQLGVRGRMLAFLRELYDKSEFQLMIPGYDAPTIKLERGLRQGCPSSCILFDIFINDIYGRPDRTRRGSRGPGVEVPGVPMDLEGRLPGLLFADDLVAIEESRMRLQAQADLISKWCYRWEMKVGIKKCGVMCVSTTVGDIMMDIEQGRMRGGGMGMPIMLMKQEVPVVEEYAYLGLVVDRKFNLKAMVEGRRKKAEKAAAKLHPFLKNQAVPLAIRVAVFRVVVMSTMMYGGEVWGMEQGRCNAAQKSINKSLRLLLGCKENDSSIPVAAMWRELQVPPVHAMASARKARVINKYHHLSTWISTIIKYPARTKEKAWAASGEMWMKRRGFKGLLGEQEYGKEEGKYGEPVGRPGRRAMKVVQWETWKKVEATKRKSAPSSAPYFGHKYVETSWAYPDAIPTKNKKEQVSLGRGLRSLALCRLGALWTSYKLADRGLIDGEYKTKCPCCGRVGKGETIEHILLSCSRWAHEREMTIRTLIDDIDNVRVRRRRLPSGGRVALLLGGEVMGFRLSSWLPEKANPTELEEHVGDSSLCGLFRVAAFFQEIASVRSLILRKLERVGRNAPLQSQGPVG
jgi:hypothetical protein